MCNRRRDILRYVRLGLRTAGQIRRSRSQTPGTSAGTAPAKAQVKIALRPTVGDLTTYKITTQARRTTKWQGPVPDKAVFDENFNEERVEMVLTQRIQSVDPNGIAVAQVTIDGAEMSLFK